MGNAIQEKSYAFAVRIVKLYQHLSKEKHEHILSRQVLRSGTSIGANVEEGIGGHNPKDFCARLRIAYKEARETKYWLCLLRDTGYLSPEGASSILRDCEETLCILASVLKTVQAKQ